MAINPPDEPKQSSQDYYIPTVSNDSIPDPTARRAANLSGVVAGGITKVNPDRQWYEWPFAVEVWLIAINVAAFIAAGLLFGAYAFGIVFVASLIFWVFGYVLIWKVAASQ